MNRADPARPHAAQLRRFEQRTVPAVLRGEKQAVDALLGLLAWRHVRGQASAAQIAMLKNLATEACEFCAAEAVQIHGGHGVLRHNRVDRLFRESKILSIGGAAVGVLKDLAARQLGY